jgi:hypothetical protein
MEERQPCRAIFIPEFRLLVVRANINMAPFLEIELTQNNAEAKVFL